MPVKTWAMDSVPNVFVSSFISAEKIQKHSTILKVISLIDIASPLPEFTIRDDAQSWSVFRFRDTTDPENIAAPDKEIIASLLSEFREWNKSGDILIHCHQGVSRSSAAALLLLALYNNHLKADLVVKFLRTYMPWANPNELIVYIGDGLLNLESSLWKELWRENGPTGGIVPTPTVASFPILITPTD
jgi:predicted protein tyrosine phosphatase